MIRFDRFAVAVVLGGAGVPLTPAPAPAQYMGSGFGRMPAGRLMMAGPWMANPWAGMGAWGGMRPPGLQPLPSLPSLPTLSSPPFGAPASGYASMPYGYGYSQLRVTGPGGTGVRLSWPSYGGYGGAAYAAPVGGYSPSGGYSSGSAATDTYQQNYARAQRAAGGYGGTAARARISDQWTYEQSGAAGRRAEPAPSDEQPDAPWEAAAAGDEVVSGEALNHLLAAVAAAEARGARGPSAHLPPDLLARVRFAGPPAAGALNRLRAGRLVFPAAFDDPALRSTRDGLGPDFAAAVAPLLAGKPVDPARAARLGASVKAAREKLTPVLRDLPLDEAAAACRFLSELGAAAEVLREPRAAGLVDPRWATEGTDVAALVRHMARHKLQFGPAGRGGEDAYLALHRALGAYLFALRDATARK